MRNETESRVRFIRLRTSELDERCRQRLYEEFEMDEESVDVIMNLRSQVIALQERLREMEAMLETYQTGYNSRLIKYREVFYEADWEDS
jgi:CBS domain containing-hemolysin-like protein